MHRTDNSRFLLYIEPKVEQKSKEPIEDEITKTVEMYFNKAKSGTADYSDLESNGEFKKDSAWRGCHKVDCGESSSNKDYLLDNGMITNSLCVFYLRYYRDAIPESEMNKVHDLCAYANES